MAKLSNPDTLVIHCSATKPSMDLTAATVRKWHMQQGWADIGYHWFIRRDGTVEKGRKETEVGAHVQGWNTRSLGICLAGGVSEKDGTTPEMNYTAEQWLALETLCTEVLRRHPTIRSVIGHRDTGAKKACPSFDAKEWWANRAAKPLDVAQQTGAAHILDPGQGTVEH